MLLAATFLIQMTNRMQSAPYQYYKTIFEGQEKPFAYVDLDFFDQNIQDILKRVGQHQVRIASKSIRCTALMRRILESDARFQGIMCYTATEAVWLSQQGFDDLLVAYPTVHPAHIQAVGEALKAGKRLYLMTDKVEHLQQINAIGEQLQQVITVCLDIDMSTNILGLHFGVRRSSVHDQASLAVYLKVLETCPFVALKGVMGYEAQLAGVGDQAKGQWLMNIAIRQLQRISKRALNGYRAALVAQAEAAVGKLDFVNGGGTGSVEWTKKDPSVTEITVGSGFYAPALFDHYSQFQHLPAAGYAIEVVRQPTKDIYTCLGGGYVASGSLGMDKLPQVYLPKDSQFLSTEMAGEVQTPIVYKGKTPLKLGDPIFLRHSKAGELCERFRNLLLVKDGQITNTVPTYRGEEQCFL